MAAVFLVSLAWCYRRMPLPQKLITRPMTKGELARSDRDFPPISTPPGFIRIRISSEGEVTEVAGFRPFIAPWCIGALSVIVLMVDLIRTCLSATIVTKARHQSYRRTLRFVFLATLATVAVAASVYFPITLARHAAKQMLAFNA
ncbi:MAG: hypothetical protein QXP01_01540 [Candidatus Hadarchaeum sp.]